LANCPVDQVVINWEAFGALKVTPIPGHFDLSAINRSFDCFDAFSKWVKSQAQHLSLRLSEDMSVND